MARFRIYPHRTARPGSVMWHPWWILRDGVRTALEPVLGGWDYASDETVGISVAIDVEALLESTGLESTEDLEVLALGDCAAVQQRFSASRPLAAYESGTSFDVPLHLPTGQVASSIRLSAHLVLAGDKVSPGSGVASQRGARLHASEPFTVRLEGDSSRFPTEVVPFSEVGLGRAPWTVLSLYESMTDPFMGGVRLLVNSEHPAGQMALNRQTGAQMAGLLRADVVRLLIAGASRQPVEVDDEEPGEGSVGSVLDSMCSDALGMSLSTVSRIYREDPAHFEVLLHDRLDPFAGVGS